ncbi:MAG: TRAP transporter large permease subunit [Planctomycetes bacterium]|nr:TRAP transporter large permease subunit [Planctomycetota bacterium]
MPHDALGPLMFAAVFLLIFVGYPVAFTLAGVSLAFAVLGVWSGHFGAQYLALFPERVFGVMANPVLLAVPYFVFMGTMLERSRLAEDLLRTIGLLFGPLRGGLALAVVFVGTLLAAATGVVGASVVAMGMISLPIIMQRYGYDPRLATGVICASGTLGQIIPPSVVLVVLGDQLGVSVGELFKGAMFPGLLLAGLFAIHVLIVAWRRPACAPAIPRAERDAVPHLGREVLRVMVPPLALVLVVLGSIFGGVATPTEAGALGAFGATLLAVLARRLDRATLRGTIESTLRITAMVMFLLIGSTAFTLVFRGLHGDLWIEGLLTNLPGGWWGLIVVANLAVFALGFFIDFFEIAFIVLPMLMPAVKALGIEGAELVWFGVMLAMNLQTSFLTPPFGFALFYLRGVTPAEIPTSTIYRGVIPFIAIQLVALVIVIAWPGLVTSLLGPTSR